LKSAYRNYRNPGSDGENEHLTTLEKHPEFTIYHSYYCENIDYIMSNEHLRELSILEMPERIDVNTEWALPNRNYPSDHLRIETFLEIVK